MITRIDSYMSLPLNYLSTKLYDIADVFRGESFGGISPNDSIEAVLLKFGQNRMLSIPWEPSKTDSPGGWMPFDGVEYFFTLDPNGHINCTHISIKPRLSKPHYLHENRYFHLDPRGLRMGQKISQSLRCLRKMGFTPTLYREEKYMMYYRLSDFVALEFEFDDDTAGWEKERATLGYIGIFRDRRATR